MKNVSVFNHCDFEVFLENEVVKNSHHAHGMKKKIAEYLNIHPTTLSQIFMGTRVFSEDQVFLLSEFLNLSTIEREYVILLHQIYITQNKKYKEILILKKENLKKKSLNLNHRLQKDRVLTDLEKSTFFSSWHYSCVFVFISINEGKTKNEIADRLGINVKTISEILEFLITIGLCEFKKGKFKNTNNQIHLEKKSPFLKQHHINWRIKAVSKFDRPEDEDLTFTAPLSLSKNDFNKLREEMVKLIQHISETVKETVPEDIYSLNLDFIRI
jgi:uncharacterized protein (TIGR02147 family)